MIKQSEKVQFWEEITTEHEENYFLIGELVDLFRLWVPGGWLVKEVTYRESEEVSSTSSICYMPDPGHIWDIGTISKDGAEE